MIIKKITTGFVIQNFDTVTKEFISAEFFAGDDIDYENQFGDLVEVDTIETKDGLEPYISYDMVQPVVKAEFLYDTPTQLDGKFGTN